MRSDALATALSDQMNGLNTRENAAVGGTVTRAVGSALHNAMLLGASSPKMICRAVIRPKASAAEIVCCAAGRKVVGRSPSSGSISVATNGSPIHPRPRLAMVMPSWVAATNGSGFSVARWTSRAPRRPARTNCAIRVRRALTMENSAATNKPLAATRANTANRRSAIDADERSMRVTSWSEVPRCGERLLGMLEGHSSSMIAGGVRPSGLTGVEPGDRTQTWRCTIAGFEQQTAWGQRLDGAQTATIQFDR